MHKTTHLQGITMGLLVLVAIGGCKANERLWWKDNIHATGKLYEHEQSEEKRAEYWTVKIGSPVSPIVDMPKLGIQTESGHLIALKDITLEDALMLGEEYPWMGNEGDGGWDKDGNYGEWPATTVVSVRPIGSHHWNYYLRFLDGKLVEVTFSGIGVDGDLPAEDRPNIWDLKHNRSYSLYLTDEDLVDLFGPPDRVLDVHRHGWRRIESEAEYNSLVGYRPPSK